MLIHSLDVDRGQLDPDEWPCTIPAIRQVVEGGLAFSETKKIDIVSGVAPTGRPGKHPRAPPP